MKRLEDVLDKKNYRRLTEVFGGQRIWIPKPGNRGYRDRVLLTARNVQIVTLHKSGRSARELARIFDLSLKSIYNIIDRDAVASGSHRADELAGQKK